MNITILGAGAWGTALGIHLSKHHTVSLWGRNTEMMRCIADARENVAYLSGFSFPPTLHVTSSLTEALAPFQINNISTTNNGLLILATSLSGCRSTLERLKQQRAQGFFIPPLIWLCKGFEQQTQQLPHHIVQAILGDAFACGVLSGPSFAQEVVQGLPCALVMASHQPFLVQQVTDAMHTKSMRIYATHDVIGVEVGGAVKNILAIATGIADGLGCGYNARSALITRGLYEITRLGLALGGIRETFTGLSGMGDLILTCTSDLSRNRRVGLGLAKKQSLATIISTLGHVAEGVHCVGAVQQLAKSLHLDMPISTAVAEILFEKKSIEEVFMQLLARTPKEEM